MTEQPPQHTPSEHEPDEPGQADKVSAVAHPEASATHLREIEDLLRPDPWRQQTRGDRATAAARLSDVQPDEAPAADATDEQPPLPAWTEQHRPPRRPRPMVWIACLAAYTNGELHGRWVDAAVEHEELVESARQVIASSPSPDAEEWAIFEHDEFGGFRVCEYADLAAVARVARGIRDHGPAFGAWAELHDADPDMLEQFGDAYLGHYDSTTEWAEQVLQDTGAERFLDNVPESLRPYVRIDYAAWARDCDLGGDIHVEPAEGGGVHIFHIA